MNGNMSELGSPERTPGSVVFSSQQMLDLGNRLSGEEVSCLESTLFHKVSGASTTALENPRECDLFRNRSYP